jgi:hypothetical protein
MNEIVDVSPTGELLGRYRPMISDTRSSGFYRAVIIRDLFRYLPP